MMLIEVNDEFDLKRGKLRRLCALIKKEGFQIIRDPSSLLISVVLPLFLLFIYGFGVSLDIDHLRIGLVVEDNPANVKSLIESFTNSTYLDVKVVHQRKDIIDDITRGAIRGFIVIPSYFSQFDLNPDQIPPIQVIADGSETNTANFVHNYANGAIENWLEQRAIERAHPTHSVIDVASRMWYNEEIESRYFLLSGSLAIIMTLIGTLLTALVVAREWERGTMEALMSTTVQIDELVLGKLIPYFILGMMSMMLCVLVSVWGYGLPLRGSLLLLLLVSAVFLVAALGLGLLISTFSRNQLLAYQISVLVGFLPSYILSGFLFEISSMPAWVQFLTYFMPAKYFVTCLQTLFLVGNVWKLILTNLLIMTIMGTILFIFTSYKTVKRLD